MQLVSPGLVPGWWAAGFEMLDDESGAKIRAPRARRNVREVQFFVHAKEQF
jgi:hypothetical protein